MFRVYLTNLGKYNEGELVGEWVDLPVSDEELSNIYKRIGISFDEPDENGNWYEETFITDYENDIGYQVGEWDSIEDLNEIAERVGDLNEHELKVLEAAIEHGFVNNNDDIANFDPYDYSLVEVSDDSELGYYLVDDVYGGVEKLSNDTIEMYFDYESFGRDIRLEFSVWDVFDGDESDEDDVREFCDQFNVEDLDDVNAYVYYGASSDYELGFNNVEEYGMPSEADRYFDYEGFGGDYATNADGGYTSEGFIERA